MSHASPNRKWRRHGDPFDKLRTQRSRVIRVRRVTEELKVAEGNGQEQAKEEAPVSQIVIKFVAPGALDFSSQMVNVSPAQMIFLASRLTHFANQQIDLREQQAAAAKTPRILVPTLKPPPMNLPCMQTANSGWSCGVRS